MRAEKYNVVVSEVQGKEWTEEDKRAIEQGVEDWKKSRSGIQIASTTLQPWLDQEHRRYWVARQEGEIVGILILTPVQANNWQIKNAVAFPKAPKGTSEVLIYTSLQDLHAGNSSPRSRSPSPAGPARNGTNGVTSTVTSSAPPPSSMTVEPPTSDAESGIISDDASGLSGVATPSPIEEPDYSPLDDENRVVVTFGISASPELHPVHNLGGWKVKALSKTYKKVASSAKLINRGEFRVGLCSGLQGCRRCTDTGFRGSSILSTSPCMSVTPQTGSDWMVSIPSSSC
jgi:hypothetical protein